MNTGVAVRHLQASVGALAVFSPGIIKQRGATQEQTEAALPGLLQLCTLTHSMYKKCTVMDEEAAERHKLEILNSAEFSNDSRVSF